MRRVDSMVGPRGRWYNQGYESKEEELTTGFEAAGIPFATIGEFVSGAAETIEVTL